MEHPKYKIALIVGAGEGLSASLARLLSAQGIRVAVAARKIEKLGALCCQTGAKAYACNATEPEEVERLFGGERSARAAARGGLLPLALGRGAAAPRVGGGRTSFRRGRRRENPGFGVQCLKPGDDAGLCQRFASDARGARPRGVQ